jgi:hypothetical protein
MIYLVRGIWFVPFSYFTEESIVLPLMRHYVNRNGSVMTPTALAGTSPIVKEQVRQ